MEMTIKAGDVVRETGSFAPMTVERIRESDDGRVLADCRYREQPPGPGGLPVTHPDADADGYRRAPFVLASLVRVEPKA